METRDIIHSAINAHINIDDTYAYFLTRTKEAFSVGTVTLDDFVEWTDEDIADLTDSIIDKISPELNHNQQVVLELLKKAYLKNKWMTPFGAVFSVANDNDFAIRAWLTKEEQFQVLLVFIDWGMNNLSEQK